jgi:hypothetical protein
MAYYPSARRLILPIRFMVRCVRIMLCPDNLWTSEYRRTCARVEGAVVDVGAHLIVAPAFPAGRAVARVLVQPVGAGGGATTNDDVARRRGALVDVAAARARARRRAVAEEAKRARAGVLGGAVVIARGSRHAVVLRRRAGVDEHARGTREGPLRLVAGRARARVRVGAVVRAGGASRATCNSK